jgi:hypothetical protein
MTDNAYFMARPEDGIPVQHKRGLDNIYHVEGDIICAPIESAKKMLQQVMPVFSTFSGHDKILLTPLPRYLYDSCCEEPDHAPNVLDLGHVDSQLADLDATYKMWRGMLFKERAKCAKVCNAGPQLKQAMYWSEGPVHPTKQGYGVIVDYLVNAISALDKKRVVGADLDEQPARKRGADEPVDGWPKRNNWSASAGIFANRWEAPRGGGNAGGSSRRGSFSNFNSRGGYFTRGRGNFF